MFVNRLPPVSPAPPTNGHAKGGLGMPPVQGQGFSTEVGNQVGENVGCNWDGPGNPEGLPPGPAPSASNVRCTQYAPHPQGGPVVYSEQPPIAGDGRGSGTGWWAPTGQAAQAWDRTLVGYMQGNAAAQAATSATACATVPTAEQQRCAPNWFVLGHLPQGYVPVGDPVPVAGTPIQMVPAAPGTALAPSAPTGFAPPTFTPPSSPGAAPMQMQLSAPSLLDRAKAIALALPWKYLAAGAGILGLTYWGLQRVGGGRARRGGARRKSRLNPFAKRGKKRKNKDTDE